MEQQLNDIYRGKPKNSEKNLSRCHSVDNKSVMGVNSGLRGEKTVTNRLRYDTAPPPFRYLPVCYSLSFPISLDNMQPMQLIGHHKIT
jgi:hypothetical protein